MNASILMDNISSFFSNGQPSYIAANLQFLRPEWFWLLVPVVLFAVLGFWRQQQSRQWQQVIAPHLLPFLLQGKESKPKRWPIAVWLLGLTLLVTALAGPTWEKIPTPVLKKVDALVIVVDLSESMNATDISPSRVTRVKHKLEDILELRTDGITALIVYAGDAHVVTPLTHDVATIENMARSLSTNIMPVSGNDASSAIKLAIKLLQQTPKDQGEILLITDEVSEQDTQQINELLGDHYKLSILGVGTAQGGPIPLADGSFLKDNQGSIVIPKLDQSRLATLAAQHGGKYTPLTWGDDDIKALKIGEVNEDLQTAETERQLERWLEAGPWLVLVLLPFFALSFRRSQLLGIALVGFLAGYTEPSQAGLWQDLWVNDNQQGQHLLEQGEAKQAAEKFKNPQWKAVAQYEAGEFEASAENFQSQPTTQSWYNQGNALAKAMKLDEAITAFDKALETDPNNEDAQFNKQLVEQLKQQQEQQEGNEGDQDQSDQQQSDQSQSEQSEHSEHSEQGESGEQSQQNEGQQGEQNQDQNSAQSQNDLEDMPEPSQQDSEGSENKDPSTEQEQQEQNAATGQAEQESANEQNADATDQQALPAQMTSEDEQAKQQWLQRIPDDPGSLLRRKFYLESQENPPEEQTRSW